MNDDSNPTTRRGILIGAAALTGLPLLAVATSAAAAGTLPKANAKYQTSPNANGQQCSKCSWYLAPAAAGAAPMCKIVAGPIAANGWCTMYKAKA